MGDTHDVPRTAALKPTTQNGNTAARFFNFSTEFNQYSTPYWLKPLASSICEPLRPLASRKPQQPKCNFPRSLLRWHTKFSKLLRHIVHKRVATMRKRDAIKKRGVTTTTVCCEGTRTSSNINKCLPTYCAMKTCTMLLQRKSCQWPNRHEAPNCHPAVCGNLVVVFWG